MSVAGVKESTNTNRQLEGGYLNILCPMGPMKE